jgi:hypothetical protein
VGVQQIAVLKSNAIHNTLEPQEAQRFVVDGWITGTFDLDVGQYLTLAAQTVELLNGPLVARIIVP